VKWGGPILVDNFTGSALDLQRWGVYDDPKGNSPRVREAVRVNGGELQIVGGINDQGHDVSGGIASRLNRWYGRWEVRLRVDRGAGYSAAVLLWPQTDLWPDDGEIDVMEINHGDRDRGLNYIHNNHQDDKRDNTVVADFTQWHTVAVEWLPDRVTYFLDGQARWTIRKPANRATRSLVPSTAPMHLTLQFDQGCGGFFQCRTAQTPPHVLMHVDWIKVYAPPT
jgi:beta-glucanase (GH16 family)